MSLRHQGRLLFTAAWTAAIFPAAAVADVTATPDPSGLPGTAKLQQLVNGMYLWVLMLTLAALVVAATVWAWGSHSNNVRAASDGRRGVGVALLAALIVGAAPMLVNWFYRLGR
jgi:Family of unknown function (DUF6112)